MKKRTLNQTWILCLRMWRWRASGNNKRKPTWKAKWLRDNGIESIRANCFFCAFAKTGSCEDCPGILVDPTFNCYNPAYCFHEKPEAFYKELLRLNKIRKGKK